MSNRKGVLTFEWMLLLVLLVLGIVGGLAVLRDATIIEYAETADAILHYNKTYHIPKTLTTAMIASRHVGEIAGEGGAYIGDGDYVEPGVFMLYDGDIHKDSGETGQSDFVDTRNKVGKPRVSVSVPESPVNP